MDYIEEYIKQLLSLGKGEKTKFDVHFIVSEPLTSFCFDVNQKIRKRNTGYINMGVESIVVPHISLFMGFMDNYEQLERVFSIAHSYAKSLSSFILNPTCMYFKSAAPSAPQYLFIDSLQNDYLMQQKDNLDRQLKDVVYPLDWNMKKERAHITVGCYKNITPSVRKIVESYNSIPSCRISQLGVSLSGKRGVCLSLLKVFDF